jgi:uncharacterized damage-inducible protein DinB
MLKVPMALAGVLLAAGVASAQSANPVADALLAEMKSNQQNMVSAAEAMPAEKYSFKPTPEMTSLGDILYHAAQANHMLCSMLSGAKAPETAVKGNGTKQALIDQLKGSFAFCESEIPRLDPASLGSEVTMFGRKVTKAWVALHTALDYGDHYAQVATRLRLAGVIPPSAQRRTQ